MSRALAMLLVLVCAAGCGGDDGSPERGEKRPEGVRLSCDDAISGAGARRSTRGSITLGPVELAGLGRLDDPSFARRGGVKIPLLVEPWNAVTIRIVTAHRGSLGFIPHPPGAFPPGRPSSPLPDASSATLTIEGCAPRPGSDPRSFLPSFVAIARPACARFEVRDAGGGVARRTVSIGAGRCADADAVTAAAASPRACMSELRSRVLPGWARAGFTDRTPRAPHAVGRAGEIAAIVFGGRLVRPPSKRRNNKILWVSRRAADDPSDLRILAQRMHGSRDVGPPVRRRVEGGPGPSIVDLPGAGCWRLALRWSGRHDTVDLRYERRAAAAS